MSNVESDNIYCRKVLFEKIIKMSFAIKREQKLYKSIDFYLELVNILNSYRHLLETDIVDVNILPSSFLKGHIYSINNILYEDEEFKERISLYLNE
jgi:hypothetical protein